MVVNGTGADLFVEAGHSGHDVVGEGRATGQRSGVSGHGRERHGGSGIGAGNAPHGQTWVTHWVAGQTVWTLARRGRKRVHVVPHHVVVDTPPRLGA